MIGGPKIGILGAGAIGCYLGGRLVASGSDVVFAGRMGNEIAEHGLTLTDYLGGRFELKPAQVAYSADPATLASCDVVLVTVKSMATKDAARPLADLLAPRAIVISFQNGVSNADALRRVLPDQRVLAGMVPFNVLRGPKAHFHLGTSGPLAIEEAPFATPAADALRRAGLRVDVHPNIRGILWSKLLFNLNNSVNALSGLPLREQLSVRSYRRVTAKSITEGLACLAAARLKPVSVGRMIPRLAPSILSLPNVLFFRIAATMVSIDPEARSSMWDDLDRRRVTEIDYLNGEIVRLAERLGIDVPVNRMICELVRAAEEAKNGSPRLDADELLARVTSAA